MTHVKDIINEALHRRERHNMWLSRHARLPVETSLCFQTSNSVLIFVVAALLRPEIQKIAQEELDAVTMRERLPTFEDRPQLPFVNAICKKVTRWRPIAPLGELLASTHLT